MESMKSVNIIAMYASPTNNFGDTLESLVSALSEVELDKPTVFAADINCRIDSSPLPPRTLALIDTLDYYGLTVANDPSLMTYDSSQGSSAIDLFATNLNSESGMAVRPLGGLVIPFFRKHIPIRLSFSLSAPVSRPSPPQKRLAKRLDLVLLDRLLGECATLGTCTIASPDPIVIAEALTDIVTRSVIPEKSGRRKSAPWFDAQCYQVRQAVLQKRLLFQQNGVGRDEYIESRRAYKRLLAAKKKERITQEEQAMLRKAEERPYMFRHASASNKGPACPIPHSQMREHFETIAGGLHGP
jgi:hypothetical protein